MKQNRKMYIETTEGWLVNLALKNLSIKVVFNICLNENRNIRNLAIYSLHNRSPIDLVYKLSVNACNSSSYLKRETGLLLLSQLGSKQGHPYKEKSIPIFIKLINDKSLLVRKAVLVAIGHLYSKEKLNNVQLINRITSMSDSQNISLLIDVAFALGSCEQTDEVIEALLKLKNHVDIDVSDWAKISLEEQ